MLTLNGLRDAMETFSLQKLREIAWNSPREDWNSVLDELQESFNLFAPLAKFSLSDLQKYTDYFTVDGHEVEIIEGLAKKYLVRRLNFVRNEMFKTAKKYWDLPRMEALFLAVSSDSMPASDEFYNAVLICEQTAKAGNRLVHTLGFFHLFTIDFKETYQTRSSRWLQKLPLG